MVANISWWVLGGYYFFLISSRWWVMDGYCHFQLGSGWLLTFPCGSYDLLVGPRWLLLISDELWMIALGPGCFRLLLGGL